MMVRISGVKDVAAGQIRAFEVAGTKVDVANAGGQLYALDDTCTHRGCSLATAGLTAPL